MRVIFFASGSGSTFNYITNELKTFDGIINCGLVYESNENIELCINKYKLLNNDLKFINVNKNEFSSNEEFQSDIFQKVNNIKPDLIVLVGWMHIITKKFIAEAVANNIQIINLHPTLQYQLIGRDIYPKIWQMYKDGMIRDTGCIVHYVLPKIDRGKVITEFKLNLTTCKTFNDYYIQMYGNNEIIGLEKKCLWDALIKLYNEFKEKETTGVVNDINPYTFEKVNKLKLVHRGKVRDIYESKYYNEYLFVHTSDRISANDMVISYLPQKGYLLNQINTFWHKLFGISQMICSSNSNLMVIRKMRAIPLEIIVRRRLTGSLWKLYNETGLREINGYTLENDMVDGAIFKEPIITPTTKGTHDIPITFDEIINKGILNKNEIDIIKNKSLSLFKMGEEYLKRLGIEIIDTKFEYAFNNTNETDNLAENSYGYGHNIEIIDEVFTPDSSRFIVDGVRMDKDILRHWANDNKEVIMQHHPGNDGCRDVNLPDEIIKRLTLNYKQFLDKLQSHKLNYNMNINEQNEQSHILPVAISKLNKYVVIIAGSKSDYKHIDKIKSELTKQDILTFIHYLSAHKNTNSVLEILNYYECQHHAQFLFITVAGLSNALSGVVSCNVSKPVIACPPFSDSSDYQINIHSTLQMPSNVPNACILKPSNVALFCKRILDNIGC